jgi:hypothetical protein
MKTQLNKTSFLDYILSFRNLLDEILEQDDVTEDIRKFIKENRTAADLVKDIFYYHYNPEFQYCIKRTAALTAASFFQALGFSVTSTSGIPIEEMKWDSEDLYFRVEYTDRKSKADYPTVTVYNSPFSNTRTGDFVDFQKKASEICEYNNISFLKYDDKMRYLTISNLYA